MLENDTQAVGCFGELGNDSFLKEWEAVLSAGFAALQDYYGTSWLEILRIEPVPQIKCSI